MADKNPFSDIVEGKANPFDGIASGKPANPFQSIVDKDDAVDRIEDDPGYVSAPPRRPTPVVRRDTRSWGNRIGDQIKIGLIEPFFGFDSSIKPETPQSRPQISGTPLQGSGAGRQALGVAADAAFRGLQSGYNAITYGLTEAAIEAGLMPASMRFAFRRKLQTAIDIAEAATGIGGFGRRLAGGLAKRVSSPARNLRADSRAVVGRDLPGGVVDLGEAPFTQPPRPPAPKRVTVKVEGPPPKATTFDTPPQRAAREGQKLDDLRRMEARAKNDPTLRGTFEGERLRFEIEYDATYKPGGRAVRNVDLDKPGSQAMRMVYSPKGEAARHVHVTVGFNPVADGLKDAMRIATPEDFGLAPTGFGADGRISRNMDANRYIPDPEVRQVVRQTVESTPTRISDSRNTVRPIADSIEEGEKLREIGSIFGIGPGRVTRQYNDLRARGGIVDSDTLASFVGEFLDAAERLKILSRKINAGTASDIEKQQFRRTKNSIVDVGRILEDNIAEYGRGLRLLRNDALDIQHNILGGRDLDLLKASRRFGDDDKALAKRIIRAEKSSENALEFGRKVNKLANRGPIRRAFDIFSEIYAGNILMGTATHFANLLGNTLFGTLRMIENATAAFLPGGNGGRWLASRYYGGLYGSWDGMKKASSTLFFERFHDLAQRMDVPLEPAIKFQRKGSGIKFTDPYDFLLATANAFGRTHRTLSFNLLAAADQFFKSIIYRATMRGEAYLAARNSGIPPDSPQMKEFIKNFLARSEDLPKLLKQSYKTLKAEDQVIVDAHRIALHDARVGSFTEPMGPLGRTAIRLSNDVPILGKVIMPFVTAPANLNKQAWTRTPFAPIHPTIIKQLNSTDSHVSNLAAVRIAYGSAYIAGVWTLLEEGIITGAGPLDPEERAIWLSQGNVPFSIGWDEKTRFSLERFEPLSIPLRIMGLLHSSINYAAPEEVEMIAMSAISQVANGTMEASYLSGWQQFFEFMSSADRSPRRAAKYLSNVAVNAIPVVGNNLAAQISRANHETYFSAQKILDTIQLRWSIILGTDGLTVRRNPVGDPVARLPTTIPLPGRAAEVNNDPVLQWMERLGVAKRFPRRRIAGVELEDAEYWEYVRQARQPAARILRDIITGGGWNDIPNEQKRVIMQRILRQNATVATALWKANNLDRIEEAARKRERDLNRRVKQRTRNGSQ